MPEWLTALAVTLIVLVVTVATKRIIGKIIGGIATVLLGLYTLTEAFKYPQVVVAVSIGLIVGLSAFALFIIYQLNKQDKEKKKRAEGGTTINIHPPR